MLYTRQVHQACLHMGPSEMGEHGWRSSSVSTDLQNKWNEIST